MFTAVLPAVGAPGRARRGRADVPGGLAAVRSGRDTVRTVSRAGSAPAGPAVPPTASASTAMATVRSWRGMLAGRAITAGLVLTILGSTGPQRHHM